MKEGILKLEGKIQHYSWGGYSYIPGLLGIENPDCEPFAEYWMGAHPSASSVVTVNDDQYLLKDLIAENPKRLLTQAVNEKFGELPFLFKVLDVKDMLSIQVHPTKEEAVKGFEAEEAAGIPRNAPNRNYKDTNHKPEVMVALSEFWLLHGFKAAEQMNETLSSIDEFAPLLPIFAEGGYFDLYKHVMEMPREKMDEMLLPLVKREIEKGEKLKKSEPGFWVNRLFANGQEINNIDRGIFSIYFFNIVNVQPGEAVFQGAGIPHAYLEGQNVELMANSDNVLRGGLTPKHIDVAELLKHTIFEAVVPQVLPGEQNNDFEKNYPCPVEDFAISSITLQQGERYARRSASPEIHIVVEGKIEQQNGAYYKKGQSFFVVPGTDIELAAVENSQLFRAYVPV